MKISFVIPCYRSEHTLEAVVKEIEKTMSERDGYDYEIVLTDDCSPDNVWNVIERLCENDAHIKAVQFTKNFGQHSAILAGCAKADGDAVFCLDDDGQAPVDELFKLVDELEKGYDVVYGTYPEIKQNPFRKFGTWMNNKMAQILLGWPKNVQSTSFLVLRRQIVDEMLKYRNPYPYLEGLIVRVTDRIGAVQVTQRERAYGASGYSLEKLFRLWLNGFTAFSVKPLRIASMCGALFALCGFVYLVFIIVNKFIDPLVAEGYSSTMAVLLLIGGLLMLMLGLVGEYIGRIYICLNNSPQYVVRQVRGGEERGKDKRRQTEERDGKNR